MLTRIVRESRDDGILTGLLLGPLIASALLIASLKQYSTGSEILPAGWLIEAPMILDNSRARLPASSAVLLARYSLLELSMFCSTILLFHVAASWFVEYRSGRGVDGKPDGERSSVPRSEGRRSLLYVLFTLGTSIMMVSLRVGTSVYDVKLWRCEHCIF